MRDREVDRIVGVGDSVKLLVAVLDSEENLRCIGFVPPPNEADATKILFGIKDRYEKFHAVTYTDDAINFAVSHSNRYIPDRFLPDKAIDLVDEAGARVKLRQ